MALVTPYCTLDEAKVFLKGSETWENAETSAKNNALFWGRVYIDSNYSCVTIDPSAIPEEIKFANALLAEDYLEGTLIDDGSSISGNITMKRVKAGSVESETEYGSGTKSGNPQDDVDRLLHDLCTKKGGSVTKILRT